MTGIMVLLAYIVIRGVIFGLICENLASTKGYADGFAWGFFLGVIGLLIVGFRPNLVTPHAEAYSPIHSAAQSKSRPQWECSCGAKNPDTLNYCLSCRRARDEHQSLPKLKCPNCGVMNRATNESCFACNALLRKAVPTASEQPQKGMPAEENAFSLIEQLAKLHEQGILTDEEFRQKKADVLEKI